MRNRNSGTLSEGLMGVMRMKDENLVSILQMRKLKHYEVKCLTKTELISKESWFRIQIRSQSVCSYML